MALASAAGARWPARAAIGAAVAGLVIALYLLATHLSTGVTLYCAENQVVNCERVTTSPSSIVFGIPVAFYGVVWFAGMLAFLLAPESRPTQVGRLLWATGGILTVVYLLYTELFVIGVICIWCSLVHALVLVIFALTVLFPAATPSGTEAPE